MMKKPMIAVLPIVLAGTLVCASPPFDGTIFVEPSILTDRDPTAWIGIEESGTGDRKMFDRRVNDWIHNHARLFTARFKSQVASGATTSIEIQVNSEFDPADARKEAEFHAAAIGRLPASLRKDVKTVWIHRGNCDYGGGNQSLLIHTGRTAEYVQEGILEETLIHEATHTSLDHIHGRAEKWLAAQSKDGKWISAYAKEHPEREDLAESFLLYFALKFKAERISGELKTLIRDVMPNRIAYFETIEFDAFPVEFNR